MWRQFLLLLLCYCLFSDISGAKSVGKESAEELSPTKLAKYVQCASCMEMGENLHRLASKLLSEKGGRKKMGEEPLLELLEEVCEPGSENGEWINSLDIAGTRGLLRLEKKPRPGKCGKECKAVVKVCEDTRLKAGESDIAEKLYRGHYTGSAKDFASALCTKMTDSCKQPAKELKKRRADEPFQPVDQKTWEAQKMQKKMQGMGMKGQLYDREEMQRMAGLGGDAPEEEEEGDRHEGGGGRKAEDKKRWERSAYWWEKLLSDWLEAALAALRRAAAAVTAALQPAVAAVVGAVRSAVASASGKPRGGGGGGSEL